MKRPSLRSRDGGVSEALAAGPAPGRKAAQDSRVCVGVITGAHGIRGDVKITSYTARPEDVAAYGRPEDEAGSRRFELSVKTVGKRGVRASILGIGDRDSAVELAGTRLYVTRAALPEAGENEFYHGDLIGLRVERDDGSPLGRVAGVSDFGGGDILDVALDAGGAVLLPFTREVVPVVDTEAGRIVVRPPGGLLDEVPEG